MGRTSVKVAGEAGVLWNLQCLCLQGRPSVGEDVPVLSRLSLKDGFIWLSPIASCVQKMFGNVVGAGTRGAAVPAARNEGHMKVQAGYQQKVFHPEGG